MASANYTHGDCTIAPHGFQCLPTSRNYQAHVDRSPHPRQPIRALTPLEGRVVAVLLEKQYTVPDTYPLSLNALTAGCNQKTARAPVMNVSEDQVLAAIDGLKSLSLVFEGSSSRVPRFEQNLGRVLGVPSQSAALLTILLLRGPQTAAELRLNSARLHAFADISSVEAFLNELAEHAPPTSSACRARPASAKAAGRTCCAARSRCRKLPPAATPRCCPPNSKPCASATRN